MITALRSLNLERGSHHRPQAVESAGRASHSTRGTLSLMAPSRLPRLVAFDLDGTLWWPEMYMLAGAPFNKKSETVCDRDGEEVELMGASAAILKELATDKQWKGVEVAYVSRTTYPQWAEECLHKFDICPSVSMHGLAAHQQIYPGTKTTHFRRIQEESGIDFRDMIFFDNERGNCIDVQPLGVTCIYCPDGMTEQIWKMGLRQFQEPHRQK